MRRLIGVDWTENKWIHLEHKTTEHERLNDDLVCSESKTELSKDDTAGLYRRTAQGQGRTVLLDLRLGPRTLLARKWAALSMFHHDEHSEYDQQNSPTP